MIRDGAQAGTGDPMAVTAHSPSLKEMQIRSSVKPVLEGKKKTKYLTYVKHTTYSKLGCNMDLQTNEERGRYKNVLENM